ncbi:MAG TPA: MFS transporter [Bryobacteraceae bacterium]|nr:MFS transporter [Bryobacteraceae bacterium]
MPPTPTHPTRVRYWVVVFAISLAVITYIDRVCISSAAPSMQNDLGLSDVQMGWVFGAFAWAYALFEIPGGFLGDWMGPRKVLLRIVTWWSFFTAATGWAWSVTTLTVTRFLFGMGEAGCFPNLTKAFTTWLPEKERVRAQGTMWLSARWGGAFTPPLVALVMGLVGWRHAFGVFGCLGILWAVVFWWWYRDDPLQNPKLNAAERELLRASAGRAAGHGDVPWLRLIFSPHVWLLCWQYFCLSYGWYFYITWLPTYLRRGRHMEIAATAWFGVLPLFFGGLGDLAGVAIAARLARMTGSVARARRLVAYAGFAGASGFLLLSTTLQNPAMAVVAIALASFCNDLTMPGSWTSSMDIGGTYAGTVSGAMNMWGNAGGAMAPIVNGYLLTWSHGNWNVTFYVSAAVYLMGIVCWRFLDPVTPLETAG